MAITLFTIMCTLVHLLPAPILSEFGAVSDVISDMSPEFLRGIEHVIFTCLLN